MIGAISSNTLIAALFGPGVARAGAPTPRTDAKNRPSGKIDPDPDPDRDADRVELSRAAKLAGGPGSKDDPSKVAGLGDPDDQKIQKLKKRDAEVRRHEAAHKSAAGPHAKGGPKFEFQTGPNGKQYAVGGEVSIDTSEVAGDPSATIRKMQQVRRAALAPANPSAQDRTVAAKAAKLEQKARTEIAEKKGSGESGLDLSPKTSKSPSKGSFKNTHKGGSTHSSSSPYSGDSGLDEASRGLLMSLVA